MDGPFGVVSAAEFLGIMIFSVFFLWAIYAYTMRDLDLLDLFHVLPEDRRFLKLIFFVSSLLYIYIYIFLLLIPIMVCLQYASVGDNGSAFRDDWTVVYGVFVSSNLERLHSPPSCRYPFRACYKVSRLAWSYHHGFLLLSWPLLCCCVDRSRSTFRACKSLPYLVFLFFLLISVVNLTYNPIIKLR